MSETKPNVLNAGALIDGRIRGETAWWRKAATTSALTVSVALVVVPVAAADVSFSAGGGIYRYTDGPAWQVSASMPSLENVRVHYTHWEDNSALSATYDFHFGPANVTPGVGYLSRSTSDIAERSIFQLELGWQFTGRLRCQLIHFSSPPRDHGENLALCGIRLDIAIGEAREKG